MDAWKIKRIPYDQFGDWQYYRAYGWGWISPIGLIVAIAGAVGLFVNAKINDDWLAGMVYLGFIMVGTGQLLNGYSERKSMFLIDAKCVDVQVNYVGSTLGQSDSGWAVRAVVEYEYSGKMYQSTPMISGYVTFHSEEDAIKFSRYLLDTKSLKIYVDPKRLKRSLFYNLKKHKASSGGAFK